MTPRCSRCATQEAFEDSLYCQRCIGELGAQPVPALQTEFNVKFKLRINPDLPRDVIGVTENKPGEFLVMAAHEVPDRMILTAIAQWVRKHYQPL
jgi:hypothetical protein